MSFQVLFSIFVLALTSLTENSVAELSPEAVEEGPCITPHPMAVTPSGKFLLYLLKQANTPFYIPMGSSHLLRSYATNLLGRAPISEAELDQMQLRIMGSQISNTYRTTGYGQRFFQKCWPAKHWFRTFCIAGLGSPSTNLKTIRSTTDTIVYTDNKFYVIIVRCVMGLWKDWKVVSTQPVVPEASKSKILNFITQLGFNSSLIAYQHYN